MLSCGGCRHRADRRFRPALPPGCPAPRCWPVAAATSQADRRRLVNNIVQQLPSVPVAEAPLDREALLLAAMRAASAFAAGADDSAEQRRLAGKRFELRLRFGCGGPDAADEGRGWRFDAKQRTMRLKVAPDISGDDPVAAAIAGDAFETIEGFWLRRPWLLTAVCPAAPATVQAEADAPAKPKPEAATVAEGAPAAIPMGRRVGIAQFYSEFDSADGTPPQPGL